MNLTGPNRKLKLLNIFIDRLKCYNRANTDPVFLLQKSKRCIDAINSN